MGIEIDPSGQPMPIRDVIGYGDEGMELEIDPATGEILRDIYAPPSDAEVSVIAGYLAPRLHAESARYASLTAEKASRIAAINKRYDPDIAGSARRLAWLKNGAKFAHILRAHTEHVVSQMKRGRTIYVGLLTLSLSKQPARITVDDDQKAIAYCETNYPDAIKRTILISEVPKATKAAWMEAKTAPPDSGFIVVPSGDSFSIE